MVVVKPRLYIIQNAQIFKQADILEGTGNSALIDFNGLFSCNIFSVQYDASRIRFVNSGQQVEYRSLSGSVGPIKP